MLIGINVHDNLGSGTPYANSQACCAAILQLKSQVIRGIGPTDTGVMQWAASNGIGYIIYCNTTPENTSAATYQVGVDIAKAAGVPVAIEGLNEPDGTGFVVPSGYASWEAYTQASQAAVYAAGQALGIPVLSPSVGAAGATALGVVPCDKLNVHCYGWPWDQVPDVASTIKDLQPLGPGKPAWVTECGVSTFYGTTTSNSFLACLAHHYSVTEAQQKTLIMSALQNAKNLGVEVFCVYELVDQHKTGQLSPMCNSQSNFGVFHSDFTPKPLATALATAV